MHLQIYKYTKASTVHAALPLVEFCIIKRKCNQCSVSTDMLQPKCSEETHEKEQKRKDKQAHQLCSPATGRAVHTKHILSASIGGVMIKPEEA